MRERAAQLAAHRPANGSASRSSAAHSAHATLPVGSARWPIQVEDPRGDLVRALPVAAGPAARLDHAAAALYVGEHRLVEAPAGLHGERGAGRGTSRLR